MKTHLLSFDVLVSMYRRGDLCDDELVSFYNQFTIYMYAQNLDYQIYDSLDPFTEEECASLEGAYDWYMRDPCHTDHLIGSNDPYELIQRAERPLYHDSTWLSYLESAISDAREYGASDEMVDCINSYRMEQIDPIESLAWDLSDDDDEE